MLKVTEVFTVMKPRIRLADRNSQNRFPHTVFPGYRRPPTPSSCQGPTGYAPAGGSWLPHAPMPDVSTRVSSDGYWSTHIDMPRSRYSQPSMSFLQQAVSEYPSQKKPRTVFSCTGILQAGLIRTIPKRAVRPR